MVKKILIISSLLFFGCSNGDQTFNGIEMGEKIDQSKFKYSANDGSAKIYKMIGKDQLFDEVTLRTGKKDEVLSIALQKKFGQYEEPYGFAKDVLNNLQEKYGDFKCTDINIIYMGKIGEECRTDFNGNLISLKIITMFNKSVYLEYDNFKYAEHSKKFKQELDEYQAKKKL